jgi:hypothetical protein
MLLVLGLVMLPCAVYGQTLDTLKQGVGSAMSGSLSGLLESQLGVTSDQATGGVGSILSLAKERLAAGDFEKLAGLVPNASSYIDSAKKLGAVTGPLKDMNGLNAALSRLGMTPEVVQKFVPTVADYLGKVGGPGVNELLATVLKAPPA